MNRIIELNATVVYQKYYNEDSMWGAYVLSPNTNTEAILLNSHNEFSVAGNCPELFVGKNYDIEIEPTEHKKYGKGYSFVTVKGTKPETIEQQQAYIRAMLKESQAEAILQKYPNHKVLDLMKNDEFDYSDIKGIKEKAYQRIKEYLFKNLDIQEAIVELKDLRINFATMKKLIKHFGSPQTVVKKVKESIYNLCEVDTFGFKKVDQYALNRGDEKTNRNRIISGIKYVLLEEEKDGHSWVSVDSLTRKAKDLLQIQLAYIADTLDYIEKNDNSIYFKDKRVALYKNYYYEKKIYEKLVKLNERDCKTKLDNVSELINGMEFDNNVKYMPEQRMGAIKAIENNVVIINGKGGTGKTFLMNGILSALKEYSYCCCALSGKAAKVLSDQGLTAMTIHRMLGVNPDSGQFLHNSLNRLPYDIVVLDEASMVNIYLFYSVVSAIKNDGKLIIVGDNGQLASIGCGAVFDDLLKAGVFPQQELLTVHRQAAKSGILSIANTIRDGEQINERYDYEKQVFGELKDMLLIPVQNREYIKEIVLEISKKYKHKDIIEFQIIVPMNSKSDLSVEELNYELQSIFNDKNKPFVKRGKYEYREGDKIIHHGNNYGAGELGDISIYNGTLGQIKRIDFDNSKMKKHKVWIKFDGIEELISYTPNEMEMVSMAYAVTNHKCQGSTIKHVIFVFDKSAYKLLSKEFVYTGITRASEGCIMVCENSALHYAIETSHTGNRRTFLYDMMAKGYLEK